MVASKTFFEQIPTETVKRIATEFPEKSIDGNTEMPDEVRSPHESWREVAQKVQQERDPQRTLELVEQLIATLDQEQLCKRLPRERAAGNRSE
jgi:hypothetical protein